jgi:hypothetical protein
MELSQVGLTRPNGEPVTRRAAARVIARRLNPRAHAVEPVQPEIGVWLVALPLLLRRAQSFSITFDDFTVEGEKP